MSSPSRPRKKEYIQFPRDTLSKHFSCLSRHTHTETQLLLSVFPIIKRRSRRGKTPGTTTWISIYLSISLCVYSLYYDVQEACMFKGLFVVPKWLALFFSPRPGNKIGRKGEGFLDGRQPGLNESWAKSEWIHLPTGYLSKVLKRKSGWRYIGPPSFHELHLVRYFSINLLEIW